MAIQTINILRDYMTCEDPAVRNKYYNLLASFYHKSEGKILSSIVEETDKITLSFTDGTAAANTSVIIPKQPASQEISFINGLQQALNEKVTKVAGKGLSDKNFSSQEKTKLASLVNYVKPNSESIAYIDGLQNALDGKVEKVTGKTLTSNDFTDVLLAKLEKVSFPQYLTLDTTATSPANPIDMSNQMVNHYNWSSPTNQIQFNLVNQIKGGIAIIRLNNNTTGQPGTVNVNGDTTRRICLTDNWFDVKDMEIYIHQYGTGSTDYEWWYNKKQR